MRPNRAAPLFAVVTAFFIGSLSAHCAQPARAPSAIAAGSTCPPPPCASSAARTPALDAKTSARVQAAKKYTELMRVGYTTGNIDSAQIAAAEELEFRAVRDSGVAGPELVGAAKHYLEVRLNALALAQRRNFGFEVTREEYAVAEAEYWLEEAKTKR
jgi:hypothetical protein